MSASLLTDIYVPEATNYDIGIPGNRGLLPRPVESRDRRLPVRSLRLTVFIEFRDRSAA
jgi:hypothetical protein